MQAERDALRAVSEAFEALRNKLATIALTEDEESEDDDTNGGD
jgi:predicted RNase H-like nuclease (RuvC/YqgF family)